MAGTQDGLSEEEKMQVLHAATSGLLDLVAEKPHLAKIDSGDLCSVYLAGCKAGADSLDRVLELRTRPPKR